MGFASALDMAVEMTEAGVIERIIVDRAHMNVVQPEAAAS
jgi:hypothetical protein